MSGALSPTHWLILIVLLVVLFGAKKLPEAARGMGQSLRIFNSELAAGRREKAGDDHAATEPPAPGAAPTGPDPADGPGRGPSSDQSDGFKR